jgi:hypothetical protein
MALAEGANMSKVTGLASFTKRGLPPAVQSAVDSAGVAMQLPVQPQTKTKNPRERAQKSVVAMSFRISRMDWERLHQLAITEGVSINTLTLRGLSKLFEERGMQGVALN